MDRIDLPQPKPDTISTQKVASPKQKLMGKIALAASLIPGLVIPSAGRVHSQGASEAYPQPPTATAGFNPTETQQPTNTNVFNPTETNQPTQETTPTQAPTETDQPTPDFTANPTETPGESPTPIPSNPSETPDNTNTPFTPNPTEPALTNTPTVDTNAPYKADLPIVFDNPQFNPTETPATRPTVPFNTPRPAAKKG